MLPTSISHEQKLTLTHIYVKCINIYIVNEAFFQMDTLIYLQSRQKENVVLKMKTQRLRHIGKKELKTEPRFDY